MTGDAETVACRNCGRRVSRSSVDHGGWCPACRKEVVRRATLVARIVGMLGGLLVGLWVATVARPDSRLLMLWLLLIAAIYFLLYKLARRVAFEVIRSRGVRAPAED